MDGACATAIILDHRASMLVNLDYYKFERKSLFR
jgi:hypothetical protein